MPVELNQPPQGVDEIKKTCFKTWLRVICEKYCSVLPSMCYMLLYETMSNANAG